MRSHSKALFAVAALCAFLLVPSTAFAGKPINGFFGTQGSGDGQFLAVPGAVGGLAINQGSGDLYAFDQSNGRVQRFDEDGNYLSQFGEEGEGDGQFAIGDNLVGSGGRFPVPQIAIDQSDGSVYVADHANDRIQKFEADGTFVSVIDTAMGSPLSEGLSGPKGVAVGIDGTLYVADTGNNRIVKFDSSGAYLSDLSIPVGAEEGELSNPAGLAVDSAGAIYVYDSESGQGGRVQKFSPAGSYEHTLIVGEGLSGVATDTTNDHVFVSGHHDIYEFDAAGALQDTHHVDPSEAALFFLSLAVNEGSGPIYGANNNGGGPDQNGTFILVLDEPGIPVPSATINPVTTFDTDSASLSGEVNSNGGGEVTWRFQISSDGGSTWTNVGNGGTVPEGTTAVAVSAEAQELEPNLEYQVRLVASKIFVTEQGIDSTAFTTDAAAPGVEALDPGPVTSSSAWIGAYVNPRNAATTYYIEYSTDPSFPPSSSTSIPASKDATAGSGGAPVLASTQVKGLQPGVTYHYRVVATNSAGTTNGESRSFVTHSVEAPVQGLPDGRVWERVSPVEKRGADINRGNARAIPVQVVAQAATNGDAVVYTSIGKFGDREAPYTGEGAPETVTYLARRGIDGWSSEGVSPRIVPESEVKIFGFSWFSDDLSTGIAGTNAGLNPGDPERYQNLYRRDSATGVFDLVSSPDPSVPRRVQFNFRAASDDGQHIVFTYNLIPPGSLPGEESEALLEHTPSGDVVEVGILPGGTAIAANIGSGHGRIRFAGFNPISADGSRVFFTPDLPNSSTKTLYVREHGTSTTLISASERAGDDPLVPHEGEFLGASTDGSVVYFVSGDRLTDSSNVAQEEGGAHLYRWDAEAPLGERLMDLTEADPRGRVLGASGISDNGDSIYFVAEGELVDGVKSTQPNLYLWQRGEGTRLVAPVGDDGLWDTQNKNPEGNAEPYLAARATPDGRYLAFGSVETLTAYDTNGWHALYIYDSNTDRLTCASCGTVEPRSKAPSWFLSCLGEDAGNCSRSESSNLFDNLRPDAGRLVFDSKDALVPEDSNGLTDVYEWQEGMLYLLSSGTSASRSTLNAISESGDDVFFTTAQRLVRSDKDDLVDLYDARVGGFEEPSSTPPCIADECQGTPVPPSAFQTPASSSLQGHGNARSKPSRCRRGKVRRKDRCVARKVGKRRNTQGKRAERNRRAGR